MIKPTLITVCGPTASGKTSLAIDLAKWLKTEIISFDSRQFYKELLIGSAPPSPEELEQVKHHFIQHLNINQPYNAGNFERDALAFLDNHFKTNNTVIAVGGSGMYIKALTDGFDELPAETNAVREELNQIHKENGLAPLLEELLEKDPEYYKVVDRQNHVRVIRAIEVIRISGKPFSDQRNNNKKERNFNTIKIGIDYPREALYERINKRVDIMMDDGLIEEVKSLHPYKNQNALQTVGYKELFMYLDGNWDFDFAVSEIKKNSRRYAKRQVTWFKKDEEIKWFKPNSLNEVKRYISESNKI